MRTLSKDLTKEQLYESVKMLLDAETAGNKVIHMPQQKLYTLFSAAFQYMLYSSTKNPGAYVIRIEDGHLADKLARRAKDSTTRKFLTKLILPRRLKYNQSTFYLDFFPVTTWQQTNEIPASKLKGCLVVKGTSEKVMQEEILLPDEEESAEGQELAPSLNLPEDYYYESMRPLVDRLVIIAYGKEIDDAKAIKLPFIEESDRSAPGVIIRENLQFDEEL